MTKFLCLDSGIFMEHCAALSDGGKNQVLYYCNWERPFQAFEDYIVGQGIEGITKVKYFWDELLKLDKKKDVVVSFDVNYGDLIAFLRNQGYTCFGSGMGCKLEQERWQLKKVLQSAGLQVNHAVKLIGTENLRTYLKTNKEKYIKVSTFRRDIESFYSKDLESVEILIDDMEAVLGPFKDSFEWIVEDKIDTKQEWGFDGFFNGKDYIKPYALGLELGKENYICKWVEEMPKPMAETMEKMKPVFQKLNYRAPISTEEKIVSEKEHYFLDICARLLHPGSALYLEAIRNWPEVIIKIARGEDVRLDVKEKYWGAVPLESMHAKEHWLHLDFPKELRKSIKLSVATKHNGKYFAVKGFEVVAVAIAGGNTVQEVVDKLKKLVGEVKAYGLASRANDLDEIQEIIKDGKSININF